MPNINIKSKDDIFKIIEKGNIVLSNPLTGEIYDIQVIMTKSRGGPKRVKPNFIFLKSNMNSIVDNVVERIGFTDYGKVEYLYKRMQPDNVANFEVLDMKPQTIRVFRARMIKAGIIKKHGVFYYLNPILGYQGDSVPTYLIKLFHEDNIKNFGSYKI